VVTKRYGLDYNLEVEVTYDLLEDIPQSIRGVKVHPPPLPVKPRTKKQIDYKELDDDVGLIEDDEDYDPADYSDSISDEEVENDDAFEDVVTSKKSVDVNNNDLNDSCTRLRGFSLADENELDVSREIALKSELLSEQVNNALNWSKSVLEKTSPIRRQFFTDEAFAGLPSLSTQIGLNDFSLNSHKESPHLVSPNSPIIITSPVASKVQREAFSHALHT
jgi:hypothetical protein